MTKRNVMVILLSAEIQNITVQWYLKSIHWLLAVEYIGIWTHNTDIERIMVLKMMYV